MANECRAELDVGLKDVKRALPESDCVIHPGCGKDEPEDARSLSLSFL